MQEKIIPFKLDDKKCQDIEVRFKTATLQKRKVKTWTPQQDERLFQLHQRFPKKWNKIAQMMGNRNENQCLHRFRRLVQVGQHKKFWSYQEDQTVLQMVTKYGNNWKMIATSMQTKTGKQIRQRYINKLNPTIKNQQWSPAQDIKLIQLYTKLGPKWSQISSHLPGRPQNRTKNRFYSYVQKNYDILPQATNDQSHSNQIKSQHCQSVIHEINLGRQENPGRKNRRDMEKMQKVVQEGKAQRRCGEWDKELQGISQQGQKKVCQGEQQNQDFFYFEEDD